MASTIAHEMAHMWFGDLVTMKWWEDSWLNESFADFMGYDVAGVAAGYTDAWTSAAITRKPTGYRADRRRSTHPIAEDTDKIVDVDTAFANFDMITYAKGNAALAQLGHWLGEEDFLAGRQPPPHLPRLRQRRPGRLPRLARLRERPRRPRVGRGVAALDRLRHPASSRATTAGVPVLAREGSRPHRLTVSAYDDAMRLVGLPRRAPRRRAGAARGVRRAGRGAQLRRRDLRGGPARRAVVGRDHGGLSSVESQLTRAMLWWTAVDLCESQVIGVGELVALADRHLRPETHPLVFEGVMRGLQTVTRRYAAPGEAAGHLAVVADIARGAVEGGDPALAPGASRVLARTQRRPRRPGRVARPATTSTRAVRWAAVQRLAELGDDSWIDARGAARQVGRRPPRRPHRARRRAHRRRPRPRPGSG